MSYFSRASELRLKHPYFWNMDSLLYRLFLHHDHNVSDNKETYDGIQTFSHRPEAYRDSKLWQSIKEHANILLA